MNAIKTDNPNKISLVITAFLCILALGSILAILLPRKAHAGYIADIYQNGNLIQSIPLYQVEETYSFVIHGTNGCTNIIEVHPGSIAIVSADCPDKLCVHQGAISNTILPITCLPNRVVIQLRGITSSSITPDITTY